MDRALRRLLRVLMSLVTLMAGLERLWLAVQYGCYSGRLRVTLQDSSMPLISQYI